MTSFRSRIAAVVQIVSLLSLGTSTVMPNFTAKLKGDAPKVTTAEGLHTVSFDLPAATVKVFLPDDMAAGDTISGTVIAEPKPGYVQDNSPNSETLTGVVVDLGNNQTVPVCDPCSVLRSFVIPHVFEQKGRMMNISLVRHGHAPVSTPVQIMSGVLATTDPNLPPFAQTGRPATITGLFDGNSANTQCTIGTQPGAILAESPRKMVFKTPTNVLGSVPVSVTDRGKTTTGEVRVLNVKLSSPKTNLTRGEKTNVHMEIKGLKGESRSVPLRVVTTGTANTSGGNLQDITILPGQVSRDGTFVRDFTLTGTSTGVFSLTATVTNPNPVGAAKGCECFCELNKNPIITAGKRAIAGGAEHSFSPNIAKAACNGNQCSIAKTEYSWSVGAGSTATYTIKGGIDDADTISLEVTKKGTVELTVTVTIKCSDGTSCSSTGSKTFTVDTK